MKITGKRSYIKVELDGKVVKIDGEMVVGGFVASKNSITYWEVPENNEIDEETKKNIIEKVVQETKDSHLVITFE